MSGQPINLDPIDPTAIAPKLVAIPITPTVWDDATDGQHAVTSDGIVFQRREGLWHMDPWWQSNGDGAEIADICADPDEWAYGLGWPRKMVEDAYGVLAPITLPNTYPHDDTRCRQDSVGAAGFREACRGIAAIAATEGVDEWTGGGLVEFVQGLLDRAKGRQP